MEAHECTIKDGKVLLIREVVITDARAILDYVETISGESDFLTFGPGEFEFTEDKEQAFIRECLAADNRLFILGSIGGSIVSLLRFTGGPRRRTRHCGELGMSVRQEHWGRGIGSLMLDALIDWAKSTQIVKKINLRVRTDNRRALSLYERKGFVKEGTIHREIILGNQYFDHHWMGLEL